MPEGENVLKMFLKILLGICSSSKGQGNCMAAGEQHWVNILPLSVGGNAAGSKC